MKGWIAALCAAVVLTVCFGLPFRVHDTARLLPLKTVQVDLDGEGVLLRSEQGEGRGGNWREAVLDLCEHAPGQIFFDTAEQLVLCDRALTIVPEILEEETLRPAAQVYRARELRQAEGLHAYLSAHESGVTVGDLRAALLRGETVSLPPVEESADG